jgi:hypothetical protein
MLSTPVCPLESSSQLLNFTTCKFILMGHSHVRGLSGRLSSLLGNSFNVTGIVKPNPDLEVITSTAI